MAQPTVLVKTLTAGSANAICLSQAVTANTPMTLNGASAAGFATQRQILLTFAASEVGHNFTLVGADDSGAAINEVIAGAASTATSALNYKTVTSVTPSNNGAGNIQVGSNGVGSTPWVLFNSHIPTPNISFAYDVLSGSVTCAAEYTYDEIIAPSIGSAIPPTTPQPIVRQIVGLESVAGAATASMSGIPFRGYRLTVKSGTGKAQLTGTQAGVSGP